MNTRDPIAVAQEWRAQEDKAQLPAPVTGPVINRPPEPDPHLHSWGLTHHDTELPAGLDVQQFFGLMERHDTGTAALVHQMGMPVIYNSPGPGRVEVYGHDGQVGYAILAQPERHTPPEIVYRERLVSRWAANTALVSLAVSGSSWVLAFAAHEGALAAAAWMQVLKPLGYFALFLAFFFGIISLVKPKATTEIRQTFNQTFNQEVTAKGAFMKPTIATDAPFNTGGPHAR